MSTESSETASPFDFPGDKQIEPWLGDVARTGAAAIVNSTGSRASFRNQIAQSILAAAGPEIKQEVHRYTPLPSGGVVITHAGQLMKETRYLFHVVVTSRDAGYSTDLTLVVPVITRCVRLADLLGLPTIAFPPLGTGMGRGDRDQVLRKIVNAIVDTLPDCQALNKVIFSSPKREHLMLFHNLTLAHVTLDRRKRALKDALPHIPPRLYGLVGDLLVQLEAAQEAGGSAEELLQQAEGLVRLAEQLGRELAEKLDGDTEAKLPEESRPTKIVQYIVATGGSIVHNVRAFGERSVAVGRDLRDSTLITGDGNVVGDGSTAQVIKTESRS